MITCTSLVLTTSALVGRILAENEALATLPFALLFLCQMLSTIPASLYMVKVGRRLGFITGTLSALTGAMITTAAIFQVNFVLFCLGTALISVFNGFGQYYRFTAAEVCSEGYRSHEFYHIYLFAQILNPSFFSFFHIPHLEFDTPNLQACRRYSIKHRHFPGRESEEKLFDLSIKQVSIFLLKYYENIIRK